MINNSTKTIAVIGATGAQGGGVVRALQQRGSFKVRAGAARLTGSGGKEKSIMQNAFRTYFSRSVEEIAP